MKENIKEINAKEGKEITELIQEWINENIYNMTCKIRTTELQCKENR